MSRGMTFGGYMKRQVKISVIILLVLTSLFMIGCGRHHSESKANKYILSFLEKKYDERFEIKSIEKESDNSQFPYKSWYSYEAVSKDTNIEFDGKCDYYVSKSGSAHVGDNYQDAKYMDDMEQELSGIDDKAQGWELQDLDINSSSEAYYGTTSSTSSSEYLRDNEKIEILLKMQITTDDPYEAFPSMYAYLKQFDDINDNTTVRIYTRDRDVRALIKLGAFDSFTYEAMVEMIEEDFSR